MNKENKQHRHNWPQNVYRKERPRCRSIIEGFLKDGYSLEDIANGHSEKHCMWFCDSLKKQARKMLLED